MKHLFIYLSISLISIIPVNGLVIKTRHIDYSLNQQSGEISSLIEYKIYNCYSEPLITWFDSEILLNENDSSYVIGYFFRKNEEGISLDMLLRGASCPGSVSKNVIGKTFLKRIEPHATFRYMLLSREIDFERYVFVVKESDLNDNGIVLSDKAKQYLFKYDYVVIP